ncbi:MULTISPECIES: HutD/Ves family protein [Providencia]|uniref:HutD/Ves family protein n=1 Tax=Providencia TaxID=586 RepID=UPI0023612FE2|nr:HutD family protein [Providencia rettgeri]MDR2225649.1 HutD family protein [Providencia sp.]
MKIKCFDITDLPNLKWNDGGGASQEVFCWPVASDYSLRASIATINQDSYLKRYAEGERLAILLNNQNITLTDNKNFTQQLSHVGESAQFSAQQYAAINVSQPNTQLLNFIFRADRWVAKSTLVKETCKLPNNQAGLVFVLSGEWAVSGGNCNRMGVGQGGWWLPDIGEGEVTPLSADSLLIWIELLPR